MQQKKKVVSKTRFQLRLYVAGNNETSLRAVKNLRDICDELIDQKYKLEIIDIIEDTRRSLDDGIFVTPTLLKIAPLPEVKVIGDLSDTESLCVALGLKKKN
jgi:circadian clock protein KaiB